MKRALVLAALLMACKTAKDPAGTPVPLATPALWSERGVVLELVEAGKLAEAEATLATAPGTADVHYLRAKLALAKNDADTAYRELTKAVELAPGWPEYQYELGIVAPLPVANTTMEETKARHVAAGKALARAVELKADEPRYLYARAFFLQVEPPETGGDAKKGEELFEKLLSRHADSAPAHRVLFDRAAQREDWETCEKEAAEVASRDAKEGARLYLQLAGTHLARTTLSNQKTQLEKVRAALESAAKHHPPAIQGFCDAATALESGGNASLAKPFRARCP